MISKITILLT